MWRADGAVFRRILFDEKHRQISSPDRKPAQRYTWIEVVTHCDGGGALSVPAIEAFEAGYQTIDPGAYEYIRKLISICC